MTNNLLPNVSQSPESRLVSREVWQDEIAVRRQIGETAMSNIMEPLSVRNLEDDAHVYNALI